MLDITVKSHYEQCNAYVYFRAAVRSALGLCYNVSYVIWGDDDDDDERMNFNVA